MAYKFAKQVGAAGKLQVTVPVPSGTHVEVVVLAPSIDEPSAQPGLSDDIFAEMEQFTVRQKGADDSREAIYQRLEGE